MACIRNEQQEHVRHKEKQREGKRGSAANVSDEQKAKGMTTCWRELLQLSRYTILCYVSASPLTVGSVWHCGRDRHACWRLSVFQSDLQCHVRVDVDFLCRSDCYSVGY